MKEDKTQGKTLLESDLSLQESHNVVIDDIKTIVRDLEGYIGERKSVRGQMLPTILEDKFEKATLALSKVVTELEKMKNRIAVIEIETSEKITVLETEKYELQKELEVTIAKVVTLETENTHLKNELVTKEVINPEPEKPATKK